MVVKLPMDLPRFAATHARRLACVHTVRGGIGELGENAENARTPRKKEYCMYVTMIPVGTVTLSPKVPRRVNNALSRRR